jgi:hypothetical protein
MENDRPDTAFTAVLEYVRVIEERLIEAADGFERREKKPAGISAAAAKLGAAEGTVAL